MDVMLLITIALLIILVSCLIYLAIIHNLIIIYDIKHIQEEACLGAGGIVKQVTITNKTIYICCNKDTKTWMGMYWDENGDIPVLSQDLEKELVEKATRVCNIS